MLGNLIQKDRIVCGSIYKGKARGALCCVLACVIVVDELLHPSVKLFLCYSFVSSSEVIVSSY